MCTRPFKIRYKSTDFGVPPAEPDHGLNLCDHNFGHLVQWKCVPTVVGTTDRRSTAVRTHILYVCIAVYRYTVVHSHIQRSYILFPKNFPAY